MVKRIFDIVAKRVQEHPSSVLFAGKEQGTWRTYTTAEAWDIAQHLCGGLQSLGVRNDALDAERQEKIAIVSPNRPEWLMTDIGVQMSGAVLTPLYPTISTGEMEYILKEAEVHILIVASEELYKATQGAGGPQAAADEPGGTQQGAANTGENVTDAEYEEVK